MIFFAVFFALLMEQARPLARHNGVHGGVRHWTSWVRRTLNAGQSSHGMLIWSVAVGVPALLTVLIHWVLSAYSVLLTLAWAVAVLYATLGFRQFSHHFTELRTALEQGDESLARAALADWQRIPEASVPAGDLVQAAIVCSVRSVHRHVLGVLVCFVACWVIGLGPVGAVIFRLADHMARSCRSDGAQASAGAQSEMVCAAAIQAWRWINHLPSRATALAFAVVGNFEEAVANWRQQSDADAKDHDGIVQAAAAGALNLKWGSAGEGDAQLSAPQLAHLTSLVGLVWRSVVLWLLFLALFVLARSVG